MQNITIYRQIFYKLLLVFTLILSKNAFSQTIWHETFDIPEKGYWANDEGILRSDLTGINWTIDVSDCSFSDANDYAKTVSTSGGRFEVIDTDGEVVWISEKIDIAGHDLINISLEASETGSGTNFSNKYLKASYILNDTGEVPFQPDSVAEGNWGATVLKQSNLYGEELQIVIRMNSSYANDRVILDNVRVEAVDSSMLKADHIVITQSPLFAFSGDTVLISATTVNKIGETIIDPSIELQLTSQFINVVSSQFTGGAYHWETSTTQTGNIAFSITDSRSILSASDSSITYFAKTDALLIEDFEGQEPQFWSLGSHWEISNEKPINGDQSIKHLKQDEGGTSELTYNGQSFSLNEKEFLFSFKLKNGNWDPSNSNLFYLWLTSTGENSQPDGYAIGVNASGSDDLISIWKMRNGIPVQLLASTIFDWNENDIAQINCIRTANGHWTLGATNLTTGLTFSATASDNEFNLIEHLNLVFTYTATRSGELWFDDLIVIGQNAPPFIVNAYPNTDGTLSVLFNEPINNGNLNNASFLLSGKSGKNFSINQLTVVEPNLIKLNTETITEPILTISAFNINDKEGQSSARLDFTFEYALPAEPFDLVITEIMADPNPPVGLPEAEYIEIYNRSSKYIQLENWTLFVRNSEYFIPKKLIEPGQYVVLCDESLATAFPNNNNFVVFDRFPALLNSGTILNIATPSGKVIDNVIYSEKWYNNTEKDNGGYSLERIDLERFCHQAQNWTASNDASGGTPGKVNSVLGNNPDNSSPELLAVNIVNYSQLEAVFDEPIDSAAANRTTYYSIPNLSIKNVNYNSGNTFVSIELQHPLKVNTEYRLNVANMADECGNLASEMSVPFSKAELVKGDILINEVLFNPFTNGVDFVELYNNSGLTIDLFNLKLANRDDSLNLKTIYNITSRHARFNNQTYKAITINPDNITENYYVPYPENLFKADRVPAYNNDKGTVVLLSDSMVILDEFVYNEQMHSAWIRDVNGVSLERLSLATETNTPSNWQSASSLAGYATPGYENSQAAIDEEQETGIELEFDVVSPNGDGFCDELIINFKLDQPGYMANLFVFNAMGAEKKRLMNNQFIGNLSQIIYDVRDANHALLPMGTYVIFAELIHFEKPKQVFKIAFHVTDTR